MSQTVQTTSLQTKVMNWIAIAAMIYLVLVAVGSVGDGFKLASGGSEGAKAIFAFASHPFVALLLGVFATALVQSSSTVTSVIVGLVAGGLPMSVAIPMVLGANIGTTITNTLVSVGHVRNKDEFQRAFAASTVHDFFNIMAVMIFLPLEIMFGILEKSARYLADLVTVDANLSMKDYNFMKVITEPGQSLVKASVSWLEPLWAGVAMIVIGIGLILLAVTFLGKLLQKALVGRAKHMLHSAIGKGPLAGILSGTAVTVMVQSSSTTTSLMVPLAGSGVFTTRQIYPFTMGANIGTTITALLAATAISGAASEVALTIAFVHVLFNVFAVALIFGLPFLRDIPVHCAEALARTSVKHKGAALAYVLGCFFVLPGTLLLAIR
ncbi:Na/Pi symporter [Shewanella sp. JM162201]|uniref:Na/Pi symporter n=1 Tax=Shewanella jiangmenensis TaxID=2837387 RepID=A0ABS5V1R7_9GAMM|nr:Na/Pi symporter [Shewanella jiangmenensis]MBT1443762.1 Na/Pi symporter [Shewanella jiangmenensis]